MSRKQTQGSFWMAAGKSLLLSIALYLSGQLLLTLLLLKGAVGEGRCFPIQSAIAFLSALCGGVWAGGSWPWKRGVNVLAFGAALAALLIAVGLCCFEGITWTGHGGAVLAWVLLGSLAAGALGRSGGRQRKRGLREIRQK